MKRACSFGVVIVAVSGLVAVGGAHAAGKPSGEDTVRRTIQRALPYLESEGAEWREQRQCVSCHRLSFQVWSFRAAQTSGMKTDQKKLDEWQTWSVDWKHWPQPKRKQTEDQTASGNVETMAQLILAREQSPGKGNPPEWVTRFRSHLIRLQKSDGSWKPGGQLPLQRRPLRETAEVTTMWTVLALHSAGGDDAKTKSSIDRAMKWLQQGKPGLSAEWWAAKIALDVQDGRTDDARKHAAKLLARQNKDGGWGWLLAEKSDAFGTGLALYALSLLKGGEKSEAVEGAIQFLAKTQAKNGSWPVPSTRKKDKLRVKNTSVFLGTAWAVIGLSRQLRAQR